MSPMCVKFDHCSKRFALRKLLNFAALGIFAYLGNASSLSAQKVETDTSLILSTQPSVYYPSTKPASLNFTLFQNTKQIQLLPGAKRILPIWLYSQSDEYVWDQECQVTIKVPDGRRFCHFSHYTQAICVNYQLENVTIWALGEPESLLDATRTTEGILADWSVRPTDGVNNVLKEMKDAQKRQNRPVNDTSATGPSANIRVVHPLPAYWSGAMGAMDISPDVC